MWHLPLTPDSLSFAVQVLPLTVMTGGTRSMSMPVTVTVAEPPSCATMVRTTDWSLPLFLSVTSSGQSWTSSEPCGWQRNQMSTAELYHPDFDLGNVDSTRASIVGSVRVRVWLDGP